MPPQTLTALAQALTAFIIYMGHDHGLNFLWNATAPTSALLYAPTYAIYPFREDDRLLKVIPSLASQEVRTIRDLRCLHPDAVRLARDVAKPLLKLFNAFHASYTDRLELGVF